VDPEEQFGLLVEEFVGVPGVGLPGEPGGRGFGSSALRVNGSIFAMLTRGALVVKLPRARVTGLVEAGAGVPFDANKGRPMKEWVTISGDDFETWRNLAHEALGFVNGPGRTTRPR
jgi:hypothetical protein